MSIHSISFVSRNGGFSCLYTVDGVDVEKRLSSLRLSFNFFLFLGVVFLDSCPTTALLSSSVMTSFLNGLENILLLLILRKSPSVGDMVEDVVLLDELQQRFLR